MHVRVCHDCGEEYRLDAAVQSCSDCGGLLETRDRSDPSGEAQDDQEDGEPGESELLLVHVGGSAHEIAPLLERLAAVEIRFWVRARVNSFRVHVKSDDYERAMSEQRATLNIDGGADVESGFDATGYVQCPACGEHLDVSHTDCSGCGLALRSAAEDDDDGRPID